MHMNYVAKKLTRYKIA